MNISHEVLAELAYELAHDTTLTPSLRYLAEVGLIQVTAIFRHIMEECDPEECEL